MASLSIVPGLPGGRGLYSSQSSLSHKLLYLWHRSAPEHCKVDSKAAGFPGGKWHFLKDQISCVGRRCTREGAPRCLVWPNFTACMRSGIAVTWATYFSLFCVGTTTKDTQTHTHTHQSSSDSNICFSYFSGIRIDMSFVPEPFDSTGNATT